MAAREIVEYLFKGDPTDLLQATKKVEGGIKGTGDAADKAAAEVNQSFSRMASGMQKAGQKMQTTGRALTVGVTLPLAYALKRMADEAVVDQKSMLKLESSLKRTTGATRAQLDAVNEYVATTEEAVAVSDEDLRPAFERLARTTGSVDQAQRQLNVAVDASRATGKDLSTITEAMAKANMGQVGALGRLGIATRDANGDLMSMNDVMTLMEKQFKGAAEDYMDSAAGKAELMAIKFGNLQEEIGGTLVPVLEDLSEVLTFVVDGFRGLPDWVQKSVVALALLKGPAIWLAGTGVKLIGQYIAKVKTINAATEAAAAAAARHGAEGGTLFASGMNRGAREAKTAMSGFSTFVKGVGVAGVIAGVLVSIERTIDGWTRLKTALDSADAPVLQRSQASLDSWNSTYTRVMDRIGRHAGGIAPGMDQWAAAFADANRKAFDPDNAKRFLELMDQATQKGGMYAQKAQEIANKNISARDGVRQLNDVLKQSPAQIDPAVAAIEKLAEQTGISAENMETLKAQFEQIQAYFDWEAAVRNVEKSLLDLNKWIDDTKNKNVEDGLGATFQRDQLLDLEGQIDSTAGALITKLSVGLDQGKLSAQQAVTETDKFIQELLKVADQSPQTRDKIMGVVAQLRQVQSRYVEIQVNTANAKAAIDNFTSYMARTLSSGNLNFWSLTRGVNMLAGAPGNAQGGVIPFARGGVYRANSGGGITTGPMAVIGEGREPREYVIPTDRRYRDRALSLMNSAAAELGVGAPRMSSSFTANINVTGGSDPEATAAAVADAVEQAFARKKRREGSLAFS